MVPSMDETLSQEGENCQVHHNLCFCMTRAVLLPVIAWEVSNIFMFLEIPCKCFAHGKNNHDHNDNLTTTLWLSKL